MAAGDPCASQMPEFLTREWVQWLDSALSSCEVPLDLELVIEHLVSDDDGSTFGWHVRLSDGRASAATGLASDEPAGRVVRLGSDLATARAIATDGASAQRAFAEGRLRIDGDPRLLLAARPVLESVSAALAASASAASGTVAP